MQDALAVARDTLFDWWNSMVALAVTNALWLVASLTVILLPPATAGIYYVTYSLSRGTGQQPMTFMEGARRYFWLSLRWALVNLVVIAALFANLVFYSAAVQGALAGAGLVFTALLTVLWAAMQFYVWPFLMTQEDKRLWLALKNALLLALGTPFYTLTLLVICGLVIAASVLTILPLAVLTASFIALLGNHAVRERLAVFGKLPGQEST
jgi:hypothetical protein